MQKHSRRFIVAMVLVAAFNLPAYGRSPRRSQERIFGASGQGVIRAAYSMAFIREGSQVATAILGDNPGGSVDLTRSITRGNLAPGTLFRDQSSLVPPAFPSAPSYPVRGAVTNSAKVFDPHLKMGYAQSWTLGLQREITPNLVLEARYVGTRGLKLWRRYNLNEINVVENGFLDEFRLAQSNLQANIAAGRGNTFRYFGPGTGTSPLPIILAYFRGLPSSQAEDAANYTSPLFSNLTAFRTVSVQNSSPQGFAGTLSNALPRRNNAIAAGLPPNFFLVNPNYLGGAFIVDDSGFSNLVLHGPRFTRFDMSVVKRIKLTEKTNLEFRGEFLNAFNNINFKVGDYLDVVRIGDFSSPRFGQTEFGYRDLADTDDPGGRLVQFVLRINF